MAIVIALIGTPWELFVKPHYLVHFDPMKPMDDPQMIVSSRNIDDAKRFPGAPEAVDYWRMQHKRQKRRLDGKPNRPLMSYTVEFVKVDDAI